jgi:hypothetical protein
MNLVVHNNFLKLKNDIRLLFNNFTTSGEIFINGNRNVIKIFEVDGLLVNIKSFKTPNFFNGIIYKYLRKSKAKRSFEFATLLIEKGIGTPEPIAFFENFSWLRLQDSYYVSEHLASELTFRELVQIPEYPEHELILRQFTQFCYLLHQRGIEFKDHSPGNTLIKKDTNGSYSFYLVDLNRMEFHHTMSFELRMKNLCRLTPKIEMIGIMANEYANCSGENEEVVFSTLWKYTSEFQQKFHRKQTLKKKLLGK